ncbi:hypothetical protein CRM22_002778 [Opisthorchis felineus]|uniref:Bcl-2 Bcl-2 homology region 1-3 domain-containing protein n=1 Tax=Opisthorchis felineus TaxID=147828 RepID=A0A4S2M4F2_OPIFE|nr:hypothetical protein CRM22_002778 [Opisthorchis felineus]TGZ71200.1 hypothetical protein CRM22_002778 [Opisthorchis felineus]TGZ71201.1 hypothetical protein CRM22_002778 [Opisthorchis felineus]TGZ71202.1 hypothetical protein CRM22_002778 [Opisthorchis felineus]
MHPEPSLFERQTSVLCRSFLETSIVSSEQANWGRSAVDAPYSAAEIRRLVECLLQLVNEFDGRLSTSPRLVDSIEKFSRGSLDTEGSLEQSYMEVLFTMFDRQNWGRIVVMFGFLRVVVRRLTSEQKLREADSIVQATVTFCTERLRPWILAHGGWMGLLEFADYRSDATVDDLYSLWPALGKSDLFKAIGVFGLATLLGTLFMRK